MTEDTLLSLDLPAVRRKKVTSKFEGAFISSDGGLVLLSKAVRDKPSARKAHAKAVAVRLLPAFGSMPLDRITRSGVPRWFDECSRMTPGTAAGR